MLPALLAVLAVSNLPVYLYPQQSLSDVAWPTHAVITVPQGWIQPDQQPYLLENDRPMLAQLEVAARWPDGSPKWLHAYGSFHYADGKAAKYTFARAPQLPPEMPASPLVVSDDEQGIHIDTGVVEMLIPRPFAGITMLAQDGQTLIQGPGGPSLIDGNGMAWQARHDRQAEIIIEQNGPAQVTVKATGWYQTPEPSDDAFCRFTTRITAFAGSPIIKIDHATTFADDMKKHSIAEQAFTFSLPEATAFSSETLRGKFRDTLRAAYLAQLADDRLWRIAQTGADAERDIKSKKDFERSAGWFSATLGDRRLALLTKDFWQKCPKEVKIAPGELVYYAWPKHGELAAEDPTATHLEDVYKFQCFHRGDMLTPVLPEAYFQALEDQTDTTECKAEFARAGNLQGASLHNEFALAVVSERADPRQTDQYLGKLQQLYLANPTARVSPATVAASGVLGPVAAAGKDFAELNRTAVEGVLGYARSVERFGDYGWAIYGNTHHAELMNPDAAGVPHGRPSLHRVWNNNHHRHVSAAWVQWALNGDPRMLDWARTCTDNYASIGQIRYDRQWAAGQPGDPERRPSVKFHLPGAFYHCKALLPWGSRDYGMDKNDVDAALVGHWPDPSALLSAWLWDADRWAKDGYNLWLDEVKFPTGNRAREINQTLVQAINAYEYRPSPEILAAIQNMVGRLTDKPILQQRPGPIWEPTWFSRYHEMFPGDKAFNQFLLESVDALGTNMEGIWSLAACATAYDISGDRKYLFRHAGSLADMPHRLFQDVSGTWQNYGLRPAPARDGQFARQWPRFLAALRKAEITNLPPPDEPGHYLSSVCRFDSDADVEARGTRILILKPESSGGSFESVHIEASNLSTGDIHPTSLMLIDPVGNVTLRERRIKVSSGSAPRIERPSTRQVAQEKFLLPDGPGLCTMLYASHEIGIYQPVAGGLPECELLQSTKIKSWSEPVTYRCKHTKGYLVPRTDSPITLRFTALGVSDGSYVAITPARGPRGERWLLAGDSIELALDKYPAPWLLEVRGESSSVTQIEVISDVEEPLLYGSKLEDIRTIQEKLDG